jgi:hypothetical protein
MIPDVEPCDEQIEDEIEDLINGDTDFQQRGNEQHAQTNNGTKQCLQDRQLKLYYDPVTAEYFELKTTIPDSI